MKILKDYPPNYRQIKEKFNPPIRAVFTYGDTLYCPSSDKIPPDLLVHETVHSLQQGRQPEIWWDAYFKDPTFRLNEELKAYRNQFQFYKKKNKAWMPFLKRIASDLSSPMYGNIISYKEAMSKILYG